MKKKGNNNKLFAYGGAAVGVAVLAYLLWPQPSGPAPAPSTPGGGVGPGTPTEPIKPPRDNIPTHRPSGAQTPSAGGGAATINPPGPTAPGPTLTPSFREMRRESYMGPAAYVPKGNAANGTEAPCSIGGLPYAAMADIARLNPGAAQTIANQIANQQLQICIGQNYGGRLDPDCAAWLQMEAQQMAAFVSDFGHLLPPPDASAIMAPGDPNAVWAPCYNQIIQAKTRPTPGVTANPELTRRGVVDTMKLIDDAQQLNTAGVVSTLRL